MNDTRHPFTDPIHPDAAVALIIDLDAPGLFEAATVEHPGCKRLADVSVDLDAFYCPGCEWNGRISGAWVVDVWEAM